MYVRGKEGRKEGSILPDQIKSVDENKHPRKKKTSKRQPRERKKSSARGKSTNIRGCRQASSDLLSVKKLPFSIIFCTHARKQATKTMSVCPPLFYSLFFFFHTRIAPSVHASKLFLDWMCLQSGGRGSCWQLIPSFNSARQSRAV